jgi:hypothetical protein
MTRPLRLLAIHPGASWATSDVHDGLIYGLRHHGVEVIEYRLDTRIAQSHNRTHAMYRKAKKVHADIVRPTTADVFYKAGEEAIAMALRHQVDAVVVVSAMFFHPDLLIMLRRAGTKVIVLCTESPYDAREEMRVAGLIARPDTYAGRVVNPPSGVWTNERSSVAAFASVNPRSGYIAHAWHPERHTTWCSSGRASPNGSSGSRRSTGPASISASTARGNGSDRSLLCASACGVDRSTTWRRRPCIGGRKSI